MAIAVPAWFGIACESSIPPYTPSAADTAAYEEMIRARRECLARRPLGKDAISGLETKEPGDGGPSKQETMAWLVKRLNFKWGSSMRLHMWKHDVGNHLSPITCFSEKKIDVVEFEGCKMTVRYHSISPETCSGETCLVSVVDFSALDPADVAVGTLEVDAVVTPEEWAVKPAGPALPDRELATRVAHAFSRMSLLCGGKTEPF